MSLRRPIDPLEIAENWTKERNKYRDGAFGKAVVN